MKLSSLNSVVKIILFLASIGIFLAAYQKVSKNIFRSEKKLTILIWYAPLWYRRKYQKPGSTPVLRDMPRECGGCKFTTNTKNFVEAKAIVFHDSFVSENGHFPDRNSRSANQLYVFWTRENPYFSLWHLRSSAKLEAFDEDFNLTMTYRWDSNVTVTYGCWKNLKPNRIEYDKKTNLALFMASDCTRSGAKLRLKIVESLKKNGLKVDCYGKCFGNRFEGDVEELLKTYKFFLAFENTVHCREYITEKFWKNSLAFGAVPVVWGPRKFDVQRVAPPYSFIHVDDFESVQELVKYIQYLDNNDDAYKEYFKWRDIAPNDESTDIACPILPPRKSTHDSIVPHGFCELCKRLQSTSEGSRIPSITKWWYESESEQCLALRLTKEQESVFNLKYNVTGSFNLD